MLNYILVQLNGKEIMSCMRVSLEAVRYWEDNTRALFSEIDSVTSQKLLHMQKNETSRY